MMKIGSTKILAAAAMAGLLSGAAMRPCLADGTNTAASAVIKTNVAPGKAVPAKKIPKVHDCAGANDCKALGGCKTDVNACKFKNACKGKGGCELTKEDIKAWQKKQKEAAEAAAKKARPLTAAPGTN